MKGIRFWFPECSPLFTYEFSGHLNTLWSFTHFHEWDVVFHLGTGQFKVRHIVKMTSLSFYDFIGKSFTLTDCFIRSEGHS